MPWREIFQTSARVHGSSAPLLTVHVVPVVHNKLLTFKVEALVAADRCLPWTLLDFGTNPYEAAAVLLEEWCDGADVLDLRLVDVISRTGQDDGWELAIIFRGELRAGPVAGIDREPLICEAGDIEPLNGFMVVDLERWLVTESYAELRSSSRLVF